MTKRVMVALLCVAICVPLWADGNEIINRNMKMATIKRTVLNVMGIAPLATFGVSAILIGITDVGDTMIGDMPEAVQIGVGVLLVTGLVSLTISLLNLPNAIREHRLLKQAIDHDFTTREIEAIEKKELFVEMSEEALLFSRGVPKNIITTTGSWGMRKEFVYSAFGPYVFIENGKVTSWQD